MPTRLAALGTLLLFGSLALGQTGAPPPSKPAEEKKPSALEELLSQALRDNPDLRVAEAKVREAEAELSRTRLLVIQKVVAHQHTVETAQSAVQMAQAKYAVTVANVRVAEAEYQRFVEIAKKGVVAQSEVDTAAVRVKQAQADVEAAKATLQASKADLAKAQAELPYLLGKGNKEDRNDENVKQALEWLSLRQGELNSLTSKALIAQAQAAWEKKAQPQGTVADKLRKALDTPASLKFGPEVVPLDDVLELLKQKAGAPMVSTIPRTATALKHGISLDNVPLGAAFQAVEDLAGVQFGVRDYGILVSDKLPSGVLRLHDFWKAGEKEKPAPAKQ